MAEISFYRKYRPQNFKNLVGQDHIRTTLLNALQAGHVAHAYLFCGPRGTGKTSTARLLAKAINCLEPNEEKEPCDKCEMCESIREGHLIDLIEIDAASNRGIDEIRELKDKINFAPTRSKNKVYIIDEVHMLTKEAFNALLKTLEEPPEHVFFILATTESHKVPETIISRCQRFDFKRITKKAIAARLMYIAQLEHIEVEQDAIETIAHTAEGGLRDAIGLFEQLIIDNKLTFERIKDVLGISGQSALETLYGHIKSNNTQGALTEIQNLYAEGLDLMQFTKDFLEFLRLKLLEATENENKEEMYYILSVINNFQIAYQKLKSTTIPQLPLEMAIIETTIPEKPLQNTEHTSTQKGQEPIKEKETTSIPEIQNERKQSSLKKNISEQEREVPKEKIPLTISYVKENWPRVLELIKTPFLKMSLRESTPAKVEDGEILLEFTSNFHKEKADTTELKTEIENAFNQIFEGSCKVNYSVRKVNLSTHKEEESTDSEDSQNLADQALELFGGELIED